MDETGAVVYWIVSAAAAIRCEVIALARAPAEDGVAWPSRPEDHAQPGAGSDRE
jgi:hypothetical protein